MNNNNKKKVGIITFQDTTNYGACLQSIALEMKISEMGFPCEIINYKCENIIRRELPFPLFTKRNFKNYKELISKIFIIKKYKKIKKFMKKYGCYSEKEYDHNTIAFSNQNYNIFLSGSDIIWELNVTNGDFTYFLDFVENDNQKFSYSSSFGYDDIPDEYIEKTRFYLSKYSAISTREEHGSEIIKDLLNKKVPVTLDPTLLISSNEWFKIEKEYKFNKKYILLYFDDSKHHALDFAKKLSVEKKMPILYITNIPKHIKSVKNVRNVEVEQFLWLIHHAEYVITGSYHGVVYSINFHRPFFYVNRAHKSRINTIINNLSIKNKDILNPDQLDYNFDWDLIESKLEQLRNDSIKYLKGILQNE